MGVETLLGHGVDVDVLLVEVVDALLGRLEEIVEQGILQRRRFQAVADVDGYVAGVGRADDEVGHLVGDDGQGQGRGDQHEAAPLALLVGEVGEHGQDAALGGIERAVDVGEVLDPADGAVGVVPGQEVVHVAGSEGLERPMQPAGVIGVVEVLHHDLPVPGKVVDRLALQGGGRRQAVVGEHGVDLGHGRPEGRGVVVEVGHDEPLPHLDLESGQRMLGPVEARGPVHRRGSQQLSVEPVGPVVVGAGEAAAVAGALRDHHSPVLAHGRHHPQFAIGVVNRDQRLTRDGYAAEVAGFGQLVGAAHAEPLPLEDGPSLELVELRRGIEHGRQQPGLVHRPDGVGEAGQQVVGQHCHGASFPMFEPVRELTPSG